MKERPILFSAPMVRAIRAGSKTQTRRVVKPQPGFVSPAGTPSRFFHKRAIGSGYPVQIPCPYGAPGDRLWVREAFRLCSEADAPPPRDTDAAYRVWYEADAPHQPGFGKLRPGMFMPCWASRITLEVTGVRVERLQDISRGDAMAEGCPFPNMAAGPDPRDWYRELWGQINGPESWESSPFVWVIEFRQTASGSSQGARSDDPITKFGIKPHSTLAQLKDDEDLRLYVQAHIEEARSAEQGATPPAPAARAGWVSVPAWKLRRAYEILERDGDKHGVGADLRALAASPQPAAPVEIDYPAAIAYCYKKLGHAQGTKGCIAFARGAEWMRDQIASAQAAEGGAS